MADIFSSIKRKLPSRSSSSGSESNSVSISPLDKRPKKAEDPDGCRINDSQEIFEEERDQEDMDNDGVTAKLDIILAKLEKLDNIETKLEEMCKKVAKVEFVVGKLQNEARTTDSKIKEMDKSLTWFNEEIETLQSKMKEQKEVNDNLHTKQLYAEAYSRRENLKFFGLKERESNDAEDGETIDTRGVLFDFLEKTLGFENPAREIELQRVHRLGKPSANKSRPIIARFLRYGDREDVLRASFRIREPNIKVLEDFPKEIIERRRQQMPKLKEAKKNGMKVSFSKAEPDKLYINNKFIPM